MEKEKTKADYYKDVLLSQFQVIKKDAKFSIL